MFNEGSLVLTLTRLCLSEMLLKQKSRQVEGFRRVPREKKAGESKEDMEVKDEGRLVSQTKWTGSKNANCDYTFSLTGQSR